MSAPVLRIKWAEPGSVSRAFMDCDAFVQGIRGPIGSGKSTACCVKIMKYANAQRPGADGIRRSRWAILRNTYPELRSTTMKTWFGIVPQSVGQWKDEGPPSHHIAAAGLDLEVLFLALDRPDDIRKLLSLELTGAWMNEAREMPKAVLDALTGRVGRYPAMREGGATWSGVLMDTNSCDVDHWYYRLAEEQRPDGFAFFSQPSGLGDQAENLSNLPAGYYQRASMGKSEDWIRVYIKSEYAFVADGRPVYPEYSDSVHCRPVQFERALPLRIGMDFGLTPAAVFAQRGPFGDWRVLSEVVCEDMGAERFARQIKLHLSDNYPRAQLASITGDPAGEARAGTDEKTVFQILKANGVDARPAPTNDYTIRRETVAKALTRLAGPLPGLVLNPACRSLRKAMAGAYCFRRVQIAGQERYHDKPDKGPYSHVAEALQYLLLGGGDADMVTRGPQFLQRQRQRMSVTEYRILST